MKYLKKFNERLKSQTYLNASRKMDRLGHTDRAKDLKDWASKVEKDESIIKWRDRIDEFSKFGTFNMSIKNKDTGDIISGDFYLNITFDELAFSDEPGEGIGLFLGLIPASEDLKHQYFDLLPDADFGNGFFWGKIFNIEWDITNPAGVVFKKFNFWDYDSGSISFSDRGSANRFKNLLIQIFSNPKLDYPSGYNNANNIWEKLESCILVENSFSSEYGFKLEDIADYIRTISPNELFSKL
jgi:hypothetical protein